MTFELLAAANVASATRVTVIVLFAPAAGLLWPIALVVKDCASARGQQLQLKPNTNMRRTRWHGAQARAREQPEARHRGAVTLGRGESPDALQVPPAILCPLLLLPCCTPSPLHDMVAEVKPAADMQSPSAIGPLAITDGPAGQLLTPLLLTMTVPYCRTPSRAIVGTADGGVKFPLPRVGPLVSDKIRVGERLG